MEEKNNIIRKRKKLQEDLKKEKEVNIIYKYVKYGLGVCCVTTMALLTIFHFTHSIPLLHPLEVGILLAYGGFAGASLKVHTEIKQLQTVIKKQEEDLKDMELLSNVELNHDYRIAESLYHLNKKQIHTYASFRSKKLSNQCLNFHINNAIIDNYPTVIEDILKVDKTEHSNKLLVKRK